MRAAVRSMIWTAVRKTTPMALACALLAGCGPGAGTGTKNAQLTVSHDFGTVVVKHETQTKVPGSETVLSLLERYTKVSTAYGGGFVQTIDGAAGDASNHIGWFYYVNGSLAGQGADVTTVRANDRVWWDRHDWRVAEGVPAVVGSYPAPFAHGVSGQARATVVACGAGLTAVCSTVVRQLRRVGVKATTQPLASGATRGAIAIDVATIAELGGTSTGQLLDDGPARSGVYARPVADGANSAANAVLELLTPTGRTAQRLSGQWGLVAATQQFSSPVPTWVVTGNGSAGVAAAAAHFDTTDLDGRFALAIGANTAIPLPMDAAR